MASVEPTLSPPHSPNSSSSSSYNFFPPHSPPSVQPQSPLPKNNIQDIILQILAALIKPNMFRDPMGLAHDGIKQRRIGAAIEDFRVESAGSTLIEASHIPGHVKGVTPGSANYLQLPANLLFYQYVKPLCIDKNGNPVNGYVGNYFCLDPEASPDNLGIYHQVVNPATDEKIPRQHICIRLKKTPPLTIHSKAKRIMDNFSIPGEEHLVEGGAEQFFIGIKLNEMKDYLEIVIPSNISSQEKDAILAISKRAGIPYTEVDKKTFEGMQDLSQQLAKKLSEELPAHKTLSETLSLVLNAVQLDRCPQAIQLLDARDTAQDSQREKVLVALLKSCLYATVGNIEESQKEHNIYLHRNIKDDDKDNNFLIHIYGKLILARTDPVRVQAILILRELLNRLNSTNKINSNQIRRLKILILLELSKKFNYLHTSTTPYLGTRNEFNGDLDNHALLTPDKATASKMALKYIEMAFALEPHKNLHIQELIHLYSQRAYAQYRLGDHKGALNDLINGEELLQILIDNVQDVYWRSAKDELELLHLSLKLRLYLILAKLNKEDYPPQYRPISPQQELIALLEKFKQFDRMLITLMVEKLLAMDSSDYHITGWIDHKSLQFSGADLLREIRTAVPIDLVAINTALTEKSSTVEKLDIPFLGLPDPCGISDDDCQELLRALKTNTSLKSLAFRKFASRAEDKQGNMILDTTDRLTALLITLHEAQLQGMALTYFSYDGARLSKDPHKKEQQMEAACQFIEHNTSLIEFFPDLFDWDDEKFFRRFVTALKNHPTLEVLYGGIWEKNPRAGEILYEILKDREKPLRIVLHPNPLRPENHKARKNNEWLQKLNAHWEPKASSSSEQENKSKENEKERDTSPPRMRI